MAFRILTLLLALVLAGCTGSRAPTATVPAAGSPPVVDPFGTSSGLPLPSTMTRDAYEQQLYPFLGGLKYRALGWKKDKGLRDTGPYVDGVYYGTHPAVLVYYSPEVYAWLKNGRQGVIPDGAMIIKEMYEPPADRYAGATLPTPTWTVMVRDHSGAEDGWFWAYYDSNPDGTTPPVPQPVDDEDTPPYDYPNSGFGQYCLRCHASAAAEHTFADLANIEGEPGLPLTYADDGSWRAQQKKAKTRRARPVRDALYVNPAFAATYPQMPPPASATRISGVTTSDVVAGHGNQFVTSNQCLPCHSGDNSSFGPNMMTSDEQVDLSPFAEWSWSLMGLAGRDPVFHAQLEGEVAMHPDSKQLPPAQIHDLCLRCHGVMGQRQFHVDPGNAPTFTDDVALSTSTKYGALARDGISCTVCHEMKPNDDVPLTQIQTGNFDVIPPQPDGTLTVNGPFRDPVTFPMMNMLKTRPQHSDFVKESRLCASCHTINLPILDANQNVIGTDYEQSTYLEWQNSAFRDGGSQPRSCQDCHMPDTFNGSGPLAFKIADIEDTSYPATTNRAPDGQISLQTRKGYRRHTLLGVNEYVLEMFSQYPDILGVRTQNYMTGTFDLPQAIENSDQLAKQASAGVQILSASRAGAVLTVDLRVQNRTGHRFPSGVAFRRAFIDFAVRDAGGKVVWESGRSNDLGVLVDAAGATLPSEFFTNGAYQPHRTQVTAENQTQIYEELEQDGSGKFTYSFLSRVTHVKDNRLLPLGWTASGPAGFEPAFAAATAPVGVGGDADFVDGTGGDDVRYRCALPAAAQGPFTVSATLYYQSLSPAYLAERFSTGTGASTQRLYYLAQHLDTTQTHVAGWKLKIAGADASVP